MLLFSVGERLFSIVTKLHNKGLHAAIITYFLQSYRFASYCRTSPNLKIFLNCEYLSNSPKLELRVLKFGASGFFM